MKEITKPWGIIFSYAQNDKYAGKILHIRAGEKLSRHIHKKKSETWLILKGRIIASVGDLKKQMAVGDSIDIPPNTIHRIEALLDSEIVEWASPERGFRRLEDLYGRLDEY